MVIRLVAPNTVQAWLPCGFAVVRTSEADENEIAGTATCLRGSENWIWLASSTSFLRRLKVPADIATLPLILEEQFLSSTFEAEPFSHSDLTVSLDIGDLHSISAGKIGSTGKGEDDGCDCAIEVFGLRGYAMIGAHDGCIRQSFRWQTATEAVAFALPIEQGRLRDAVVPLGFSSPAVIVATVTGVLRALSGSSYFDIRSQGTKDLNLKNVANMGQTPVWYMTDPKKMFLIVLGCFRAGIVIFPNKEGSLRVSRFVLRGGTEPLSRHGILVIEEEDCRLVIEEVASGHRTAVVYDMERGTIALDLDIDRIVSQTTDEKEFEDQSSTLRSLLRGIETLGEREKIHESDCRHIDGLISSYNAALLFVTEWKGKQASERTVGARANSCKISVSVVNVGESFRLQLPNPLLGRQVFITISFRNYTRIALADGWMLRVYLKKKADTVAELEDRPLERESKWISGKYMQRSRVMTCPVETLEPGDTKSISFPIVIDSHAPLCMSVSLVFHHPAAFALSTEHIDIDVLLEDEVVLDILHFAKLTGKSHPNDSSHELLAASQLMTFFSRDFVEKQRGYPTVSRFELPFPLGDVKQVLDMTGPSACFETPLGAQFTVSLADVALHDGHKSGQAQTTSISLRGVPHVLPFIRAAVLRRLLNSVALKSIGVDKMIVQDRTNIKHWKKSLVQRADDGVSSMRIAETKLVEALRLYRELDEGYIEHCFDSQERDVMLAALQSAKTAYGLWRRDNEHFWTPKGASYVARKQSEFT